MTDLQAIVAMMTRANIPHDVEVNASDAGETYVMVNKVWIVFDFNGNLKDVSGYE